MLTRIKRSAMALTAALSLVAGCAGYDETLDDGRADEVSDTTSAIVDRGGVVIPPTTGPIVVAPPRPPRPPIVDPLPPVVVDPIPPQPLPPIVVDPLPPPSVNLPPIVAIPDDPVVLEPVRNPREPRRHGLSTLRVPLDTLQGVIPFLLGGTRLSLDHTHGAPPVYYGTTQSCHRPGQQAYDEARAECLHLSSGRAACLAQANEDFPVVCYTYGVPHYTYVAFTQSLKNLYPSLTDKVFDLEPIQKDTWAGTLTITLNQIRSTLGVGNLDILAGNRGGLPYIGLGANAQSNQPTAYCELDNIILGCPDVELTNMHLVIRFEGLKPDPADASRITYTGVTAPFTFNRNLNNIPDWMVTAFFDVDARIKLRTEQKIQSTFLEDTRHVEIAKLLTNALASYAEQHDPMFTGFKTIDEVLYSNGEIIIHYEAN